MTEPDEALLWAIESWGADKARRLAMPEAEIEAGVARADALLPDHNGMDQVVVLNRAFGYRAGQAASAERIKALEEALRGGLSAVSESYRQAVAEVQGYDRVAERHDQFVVAWKAKARALLKEADQ